MAILEAWSHAKPVLMTKECNLSAAFAHDAAIEIQQDAQSIADNLLSVSELETEARAELGRSGQRFLSTHFSKTTVIDQLTALYADVTSAAVERQTAEHK